VSKYLHTLTSWHCSHSPIAAAAIYRYLDPAHWAHSSKPAASGLLLWHTSRSTGLRFIPQCTPHFPFTFHTNRLLEWTINEKHPFNGLFFRTTWVASKKTIVDFNAGRDGVSGWQWHCPDQMQTIYLTFLQNLTISYLVHNPFSEFYF